MQKRFYFTPNYWKQIIGVLSVFVNIPMSAYLMYQNHFYCLSKQIFLKKFTILNPMHH